MQNNASQTQVNQRRSTQDRPAKTTDLIVHQNNDKIHVQEVQHQQRTKNFSNNISKSKPSLQPVKHYHPSSVIFLVHNEIESDNGSEPDSFVCRSQRKRKIGPHKKSLSSHKRGFSQLQKWQHKRAKVATYDWPTIKKRYDDCVLAGMQIINSHNPRPSHIVRLPIPKNKEHGDQTRSQL